jgi:hypothetical protein
MQEAMIFLEKLGLFDVLLPFLLIYVMVFAIMERTKIFGTEDYDGIKGQTKKNLNALFAFGIAFFAIASAKVVGAINNMIGPIMILLLLIVLFLMLISVFEPDKAKDGYTQFSDGVKGLIAAAVLIIIILIFLNSIYTDAGQTWLEYVWGLATNRVDGGAVSAVILLIVVGGLIFWVGGSAKEAKKDKDKG